MPRKSNGDGTMADITVQILRDIRDEIRTSNTRLDQTNTRLDQTNARLEALREEMHARLGETNDRLDALSRAVHTGFDVLGRRIDNLLTGEHGREHAELRERVVRLEERLGVHGAPAP